MKNDHVDVVLEQWAKERPDLDASPMAITGRMVRIAAYFQEEMVKTFKDFDLNFSSFDLLATLLRSGPPYSLSPNKLLATSMVTSGTMTNRIDRLYEAGLVSRTQCEADKRSCKITLTDKGLALINEAASAHVNNLHRITQSIASEDRETMIRLLKTITLSFE